MTSTELLQLLLQAQDSNQIDAHVQEFTKDNAIEWNPFGRANNRGTVEVASDPVRSTVERVTNAIDAVLESEHDAHHGLPDCRTPFDAAASWLGVPSGGLAAMSTTSRQRLADRVTVSLLEGRGKNERVLEVRDSGTGIPPHMMRSTILSLNESNKLQKFYLAGAYGQGGSSTFAFCSHALIATRAKGFPIGFTLVKYEELNPNEFKIGHYVYLTGNEAAPLEAELAESDFSRGTLVRHIGFDLSSYPSPFGPNSLYGSLNTNLFDPVMPIWLDSRVHNYRRVIKGSRNALNGAVDSGDALRGPDLSHSMPMFMISLDDAGSIGIEYWVLPAPEKPGTKPSASFVDPAHPVVLTVNGQNHAEFTNLLVKKTAKLPFLTSRLICHIACDNLSPTAKRQMFVSSREGGRDVQIRERIKAELITSLLTDDILTRLNDEARSQGNEQRDESAMKQMRGEVAKLLQMQGVDISALSVSGKDSGGTGLPPKSRAPRPTPQTLPVNEPPTFIRILWDESRAITFYPGERRYIRIETDAGQAYYAPELSKSRINIVLPEGLAYKGSTKLTAGRMRFIVEADLDSYIGGVGNMVVELSRVGQSAVTDSRETKIVPKPEEKGKGSAVKLPQFEVVAVRGTDDPKWAQLDWSIDIDKTASETTESDEGLTIYYSTVFPRFAATLARFESQNTITAASFTRRYEVWVAAHSLLLHRDQQTGSEEAQEQESKFEAEAECAERRRLAIIASLMATREVTEMESRNGADS